MPALTSEDRNLLVWCAEWYLQDFRKQFVARIQTEFPQLEQLRTIAELEGELQALLRALTGEETGFPSDNLSDRWNPLIKRIVLAYRFDRATELERLRAKTSHPEILECLDQLVKPLDRLSGRPWFRSVTAYRAPRLIDYLDLERIERGCQDLRLPEREYDEKFHILQAPSLFLRDLAYYRKKCGWRDVGVAIAFLDIDHFKQKFNTCHGETKVDRNVLPKFMRTLEAHVAFHGHAYRQGGDEYMLLLPGLSRNLALPFLDELRRKLGELEYPEVPERTTVSIGLCVADPDCPLTDRELREKANLAENFAKRAGRNCIATYRGSEFEPDELGVVTPAGGVAEPAGRGAPSPAPVPAGQFTHLQQELSRRP
jgi:diguanylate cyclase (GGDEF)-like protein